MVIKISDTTPFLVDAARLLPNDGFRYAMPELHKGMFESNETTKSDRQPTGKGQMRRVVSDTFIVRDLALVVQKKHCTTSVA